MTSILSIALFVASSTAQITTSIWNYQGLIGTDKYGFYGSVVAVDAAHTTIALTYDNGTNVDGLGFGSDDYTVTVGPSYWEATESRNIADNRAGSTSRSDDQIQRVKCQRPASGNASPVCTASYGRVYAALFECQQPQSDFSSLTRYFTRTHTYSSRGSYSAGVETIINSIPVRPRTQLPPDWCTEDAFPSSYTGSVGTVTLSDADFANIQVIITAGQEKLSATAGASATRTSVEPTGSQSRSSSVPLVTFTGAAAPVKTIGPAIAGLGAAMAAFVL